ncbi:hypothetical protein WICMUC_001427 [Wickerhamomyces mucosus]|uniref:Malate dehydrogenase n=1 Tax=Wickerhamomyces mucosus TaxID=1378264 RepID=A0A9P8TH35_9ASCO|nr:hypothetical protein WICMUC_001427 [Wickerhamomyces mucosus]
MTKLAVLGASGGIGQPLSLLLKLSPQLTELSLYDIRLAKGVATDLSHINTNVKVQGYDKDELADALKDTDLVVIPAGIPRKPGMTRDDLFKINAGIIRTLAEGVASYAPNALVLVISNPVNSTVPIFKEVLSKRGVFNPRKLFGITTLDLVRARTFLNGFETSGSFQKFDEIHVIGGHSGNTIVPVLSTASKTYSKIAAKDRDALIHRVQFGGDEVVKAKDGAGSATLSMAYSAYIFIERLLKAINGSSDEVIEDTFIYLDNSILGASEVRRVFPKVDFISLPIKLGKRGVESIDTSILKKLDHNEEKLLNIAVKELNINIAKGVNFVKNSSKAKL